MSALKQKKLRGFTLIEIITAMGIFVTLMLVIMEIFGTSFLAYKETRKLQHDLENAQFVTNTMAKELRTSSVIDVSGGNGNFRIRFFDYSQNRCIFYVANLGGSGKLTKMSKAFSNANPNINRTDCGNYPFNIADLVGDLVSSGITYANIVAIDSTPVSPGPGRVGKVTISLTFGSGPKPATLQTTVSLRDFNYVGI